MIVLKHLAREYNIDPYQLRMKLRKRFGIKRRWRWDSPEDPDLLEVKEFLETLKKRVDTPP